jgi:hypothetical protein
MRRILLAALVVLVVSAPLALGVSVAAENHPAPAVGKKAPDFRLNQDDGMIFHLAGVAKAADAIAEDAKKPQRVLLAFYPKDFTGG